MANQDISLTSYDPDAAKIQRSQRLADLLQQQSMDAIPINSFNGVQAPISPFSVLAKALQGYAARKNQDRADQQAEQYRTRDSATSQALLAQLTKQTPGIPSMPTTVDGTMPSLPGQAPQQQGPQASLQVGGAAPASAPSSQDQLAAVLGAHGGPQTQMIQQAMLPQILNRQNQDYQHQLGREDKTWEAQQPMSVALGQQIAAQGAQAQANAAFTNKLPETAAERAADARAQAALAETKRYHNVTAGEGLTEDGAPNPAVQAWRDQIASGNATYQQVPMPLRTAVAKAVNSTPTAVFSPLAGQRFATEATKIAANYIKLPGFQLTANGLPLLQRIDAALKTPGSVADQELLDSFTKLSNNGGAVTEQQVHLVTEGKSISDWYNVEKQKLQNGGVLSPKQREDIKRISNETYNNYKKGYQPVYDEVAQKMTAAGIPKQFWTIPDLNKLNAGQGVVSGGGSQQDQEALAWANANPKDPRAAQIKQRLVQ